MEQQEDVLPLGRILVIALVGVVVTVGSVSWLTWYVPARRDAAGRPAPRSEGPEAPRDVGRVRQTLMDEAARGIRMHERARARLKRYRWVDREAGVAQIPIDLAMAVILEREGSTP